MKKLHRLNTPTGKWVPSSSTDVRKTWAWAREQQEEKKKKSNVRDLSEVFRGKHGK